jgi:hypothetical protein
MRERSVTQKGVSTGMAIAGWLLAGAAWADQPATVPRTGGVPACEENLDACTEDLWMCEEDLTACLARQFPGDGAGNGPALAYQECGDGTIADLNTGLLWELKVAGGGGCTTDLHAVDAECTWTQATGDWIDAVNAEGGTGFAGFSDWGVPNAKELQSIVDYSMTGPSIDAAFGPTASFSYWSATLSAGDPGNAWFVGFNGGRVSRADKSSTRNVRAVRTGACSTP